MMLHKLRWRILRSLIHCGTLLQQSDADPESDFNPTWITDPSSYETRELSISGEPRLSHKSVIDGKTPASQ